ncbi:MAG: hypothetical protein FK730_02390 [Asgard group archaeon]|nr:hypothetical protein [Asgard group archaeon]
MSEEIIAQIPGTTYMIKFGFEGKYYALFLCRGSQQFKTMKLNILKGTSLHELPEEVENGLRDLLDSEEVYLSPVIVKNVANNILEQIPESGQIKTQEKMQKQFVKTEMRVSDLINKSDDRAGKKSIIEHAPREKPKFDASADSIGQIKLKQAKPLPEKMVKREETPVLEHKPAEKPIVSEKKPMETIIETKKEDFTQLEKKVSTLSNDVQSLHEIIDKSNQEIESLKQKVDSMEQEAVESQVDDFTEEEQELITEEIVEPEETVVDEEELTTEADELEESEEEPEDFYSEDTE